MKYTCTNCHGEFVTDWTDEEASVEFDQRFEGGNIKEAAIVCDDCYKIIMGDEADVPKKAS